LEKLVTSELNYEIAAEIVKTNIKNKHKSLSNEDVELLFYDQFFVPLKPEQGYDESDDDYAAKVSQWQSQVDYTERRLMIEAKVLKPEIEKLRSEITLPDIYNESGREAESQAEFEIMQEARSIYERTLDSEFQSFNGFNVSVKDEDVEIPISFNVAEDERLAMKHGKIASKDLKTTKARRDDAGFEKRETKEAARTYGMGSKEGRGLRKGITNNRNYVYGKNGVKVESTESEVNVLREKNEEYRKALNIFREKLNEVAIFNSNLAYATRLFTEHSTTKKEKINILRRFDNVETLKESKNLYRSIKDELSTTETTPINESVGTKLNKGVSTGSSTTLIESKTYENPQFLRMKDLMSKIG
jgi:hypothetical protein